MKLENLWNFSSLRSFTFLFLWPEFHFHHTAYLCSSNSEKFLRLRLEPVEWIFHFSFSVVRFFLFELLHKYNLARKTRKNSRFSWLDDFSHSQFANLHFESPKSSTSLRGERRTTLAFLLWTQQRARNQEKSREILLWMYSEKILQETFAT